MRILSIDPGFDRVGIAILHAENGAEKLLFSECYQTSAKSLFPDRIRDIGAELEHLIAHWKPEVLAIETLLFNKNQKTAMRVAEARGMMLYVAARNGLTIHEYTPLQIKIAVTGHGAAPKEQVETMVRNLIKIPEGKQLDDEMDAVAIGLTHAASNRM